MYKVLDANLLSIPGTVQELAPLAKKYGFEGLCVRQNLLENPAEAMEAAKVMRDLDMKWGLLPTPVDFFAEDVEGKVFDDALETLSRWADVAEKMGVMYSYNHIWPTSATRAFEENFEWHVRRLEKIQKVFRDHGIRYGFEFLGPYELRIANVHPFVHTIAGVLSIADAAGGYTGFLFDTYHWYTGSRRMDDVYYAAQNSHRMINMHLNDGFAGLEPDMQRDLRRQMPMTSGVIDSRKIYGIIKASGYEGPVMLEPMVPTTARFAVSPAEDSIAECRDAFLRVEQA